MSPHAHPKRLCSPNRNRRRWPHVARDGLGPARRRQWRGIASDVVWLNANEYPGGIPDVSLAAMREALPGAFPYHYQEFKLGVVPGRPFPPLENMLRVTIGTDGEMAKFRDVFWKAYKG